MLGKRERCDETQGRSNEEARKTVAEKVAAVKCCGDTFTECSLYRNKRSTCRRRKKKTDFVWILFGNFVWRSSPTVSQRGEKIGTQRSSGSVLEKCPKCGRDIESVEAS